MIDKRTIFEIHRLKNMSWSNRKIARTLRIDRGTVKKVCAPSGTDRFEKSDTTLQARPVSGSCQTTARSGLECQRPGRIATPGRKRF